MSTFDDHFYDRDKSKKAVSREYVWAKGNYFYSPLTGIAPGEAVVLNLASLGGINAPGGMVIYADEESFSFMTPEGHMFANMITFSSYDEDETTIAQIPSFNLPQRPHLQNSLAPGHHSPGGGQFLAPDSKEPGVRIRRGRIRATSDEPS